MMRREPQYRIAVLVGGRWDELLGSFPSRTAFHTAAWLESIEAAYRMRAVLAAALDGDTAMGLWPCLRARKGPFTILGSPLPGTSTAYMGPLIRPGVDGASVVRAFLNHRAVGRYSFFACRTMNGEQHVDLEPFGFDQLRRFETYLLDLTRGEAEIWKNLKSECRNRIRKAEKSGYELRIESGQAFLADFWRMSVDVFAKSNRKPTFTRRFLTEMCTRLQDRGRLLVMSAFRGEHRGGTLVLPHDDRAVYYWAGGSFADDAAMGVNNLLHWGAIRQARSMGLSTYDFISNQGGPGRFKKTFGPETRVTATHWEHSRNALIRTLKAMYEKRLRRGGSLPRQAVRA